MNLYWGDLHNHCAISYGYGSLERAFRLGRDHLDFCSVVGHATWHDMPTDRSRYGFSIDYHTQGFARLKHNWKTMQETVACYDEPGRFATLLSYEWHSCAYGDHNVYFLEPDGEIVERDNLDALAQGLEDRQTMIIPHHIGYGQGYRGINWEYFDPGRSPVIEILSGHGGSERDGGPFPMYHTMGPRSYAGTVAYGLAAGHRFGFVGGTDHHGGYPGHYGEGRTALYAPELSRQAVWEALWARRCYAVSGDRIALDFRVDGACMGAQIRGKSKREIALEVRGCDALDRIEVVKNNRPLRRLFGPPPPQRIPERLRAKVRVEWGWGSKDESVRWDGRVQLSEGEILGVEPCFTGDPVLAPSADGGGVASDDDPLHGITVAETQQVAWFSSTTGNLHPYLRCTCALILELEVPRGAYLNFEVNDHRFKYTLEELLQGSRSLYMRGLVSEAILVHRAILEEQLIASLRFEDDSPLQETDFYYARVAQENNQWAWSSPIWVEG